MSVSKPVAELRPIDDSFFEKLMEDPMVCEEMLQVIMEDKSLKVISLTRQNSIRNLQGKSVRLDALCKTKNDKYVNIEVQRSDGDNHTKRVRYNASCITANVVEPGEKYEKIPDVVIVYISERDFFQRGKVIYHVSNYIWETQEELQDGSSSIYVNTQCKDGTDISELMQCFLQKNVKNSKFPYLENRVSYFKETEGGVREMCNVVEEYAKEYAQKRAEEYAETMVKQGVPLEKIMIYLPDLSIERIKEIYRSSNRSKNA